MTHNNNNTKYNLQTPPTSPTLGHRKGSPPPRHIKDNVLFEPSPHMMHHEHQHPEASEDIFAAHLLHETEYNLSATAAPASAALHHIKDNLPVPLSAPSHKRRLEEENDKEDDGLSLFATHLLHDTEYYHGK